MARILRKRRAGEPQPTLRSVTRQEGGRFRAIRTLIKRDEAKGITFPNMQGATRPGIPATLTTAFAGANNDLLIVARYTPGNNIRIAFIVAGTNTPLSITVAGSDITVNLPTNGAGAAIGRADTVRDAINGHPTASKLVEARLATGNDGSGTPAAAAMTNLAGGVVGADQMRAGPGISDTAGTGVVRQRPNDPPSASQQGNRKRVKKAPSGPLTRR